ncbi:MAG: helix-turn-helix transcriptional regulator [Peptoniphilus harei]|nr:helix-turn-helix transcriptional regulator [Peptoniphilus harei]
MLAKVNQKKKQIFGNSYCNNKVKRVDLETIAKIYCVLECGIEDIMEHVE